MLKYNLKQYFLISIKVIITLFIAYFLFEKIYQERNQFGLIVDVYRLNYALLFIVLFLMPFNWLMEVLKWKVCIAPLAKLSVKQALPGVLAGISMGFVTPHAVGDYFARVWTLKHKNRKKALGPILVARSLQMLPTLIFGLLSLTYIPYTYIFESNHFFEGSSAYLIVGGIVLLLVLMLIFITYGKKIRNVRRYFELLRQISLLDYLRLIALSVFRYLIFSFQFLLLLSVFDIELSAWQQFMGIAFIFLMKSALPTFNFLNDLGVREFSAILYFELFQVSTAPIIGASFLLWLINIAIPAFIGIFFIKNLNFERS